MRFVPEAVCYPIEPQTFSLMRKQLKRWSHGFIQNVRLHWRGILGIPYLRSVVGVAVWDATVASIAYFIGLPLLACFVSPWFLLGYVIDTPATLIPVLSQAEARKEVRLALASIPAFWVLRMVNGACFLRALWVELVLRRPLRVYEKGH